MCVESLVNYILNYIFSDRSKTPDGALPPLESSREPGTVSFGSKGPGQHDRTPQRLNVVACPQSWVVTL